MNMNARKRCAGGCRKAPAIDWSQHRLQAREVIYSPRGMYRGRALKPGMSELRGARLRVIALWQMGKGDPYPGEYALGAADRRSDVIAELNWIASGDVVRAASISKTADA